nr:flagellar biosynthetic protein FliO [Paenibacillus pasadenensis]
MSKRSQLWSGPRAMKSLGGLTLAQGKSIQLVEAAGRIYVLGVGDDVAALDVISDPEAVEAVRKQLAAQEAAAAARPAAEWMKLLQDKLTGSKAPEASSGEGTDAKRFETMLQQKLEQQSRQQEELEQLLQETRDRERLREE